MNKSTLITSILLSSLLIGCNSKDDSPVATNTAPSSPTVKQQAKIGTFVDAPIANIQYKTETREGVTNEKGEYEYLPGETVTFSIGELKLPTVSAGETVTPLDMTDNKSLDDNKVLNIIRLLQTLDKDANPDNGIEIPSEAFNNALAINFDISPSDFEKLDAVTNLIMNSNPGRVVSSLVSSENAKSHFREQLSKIGIVASETQAFKQVDDFKVNLDYLSENLIGQSYFIVQKNQNLKCSISGWGVDKFTFLNDGIYEVEHCDNTTSTGNYRTAKGYLLLQKNGTTEYHYRLKYTASSAAFESCTVDPIMAETTCLSNKRNYEFFNLESATAYINAKEKAFLNTMPLYRVNNTDACPSSKIETLSFNKGNYTYSNCNGNIKMGNVETIEGNILKLSNETGTQYLKLSNNESNSNSFYSCANDDLNYVRSCVTDSEILYRSMADAIQVTNTNQ